MERGGIKSLVARQSTREKEGKKRSLRQRANMVGDVHRKTDNHADT